MRPGQEAPDELARENAHSTHPAKASMRPGQEAPDEHRAISLYRQRKGGFNEAGARSPG